MLRPSRLAHNLALLVGGEIAARLLSFAAIAYLARLLDAGGFGLLSFAGTLIGYFTLGVNSGLELYGTREVARRPDTLRVTVATVEALRLALGVASYVALAALAAALPLTPETRVVIWLYGLVLLVTAGNLGWAFQGAERMAAFAGATVAAQAVFLAGVLLLVRGRGDLLRIVLLQVSAELTAAAILLGLFTRRYGVPPIVPAPNFVRSALGQAAPLFLGRAMRALALSFDVLALRFYLGDASVGLYSASSRVLLFLLSLTALYFTNLYPTLARAVNWPVGALHVLFARSLRFTALVVVPVGVGGVALAAPIITTLFGARYAGAVPPFRVHIITLTITALAGNYRAVLLAFGHQATDTRIVAAGALLNVALNLALVPRFGPAGAALAFLAGEMLVLGLGHRAVGRRILAESPVRHIVRPLAASLLMAAALLFAAPAPLLLRIAVGAGVYAATVLAMGGISLAELRATLFGGDAAANPTQNVDGWPHPY